MLHKKIEDIEAVAVDMEGVKDATVRVVFGPADGAPNFAMRVFELGPGGHTPFHTHGFEHEAIILSGDIAVVTEEGEIRPDVGDVLLVMPDEKHQFRNMSDTEPASFMCMVPVQYQK